MRPYLYDVCKVKVKHPNPVPLSLKTILQKKFFKSDHVKTLRKGLEVPHCKSANFGDSHKPIKAVFALGFKNHSLITLSAALKKAV